MANVTILGGSQGSGSNTDAVDTTKVHPLGTKATGGGKEYVYAEGSASIAQYGVVIFDAAWVADQAVAGDVGMVGVAQAAIVASSYGWFQIWGISEVLADAAVAANVQLYLTATVSDVDDAVVAGDNILGMTSIAAGDNTTVAVMLTYPHVTNAALD